MKNHPLISFAILATATLAKADNVTGEARRQFIDPIAQAIKGDSGAQLDLALAHRRAAYVWLRVAAHFQKDRSRAATIMANKLEEMLGDEKERRQADEEVERMVRLVEKERPGVSQIEEAAMRGNTEAQADLIFMYSTGDGVEQDTATALRWAAVADAFGYKPPFNDRLKSLDASDDETTLEMTTRFLRASPGDVAQAQEQASELAQKIKSAKGDDR